MKANLVHSAAVALLTTTAAHSSSWHFMWTVHTEDSRYYFDAESIERTRDSLSIWVKTVQLEKAEADGSWSTAYRYRLHCTKKSIQLLAWSAYGADGKFIRSDNTPGPEKPVVPDSLGEGLLKTACEAGFPGDKSGLKYFKLDSNDVYQATKNFVEMMKTKVDTAPQ